jgi:type I site-specific restriction-modification system R (restriction) subunit
MTEENKGTAATGSEPVKDTTATAGAEPAPDAKVDSSTIEKPAPFDSDPRWKSARLAEQKLQGLLKANDLEDVDDLVALVESGKKVHGKVDDLDNIEELKKKAETLDRYNAHWARQKEIERRQTEDPNETIARLERESNELKTSKARDEQTKKETEEAEKSVKFYEGEVKSIIGDMEHGLLASGMNVMTFRSPIKRQSRRLSTVE